MTKVRLGDVAVKIGSGATPKGGAAVYRDHGVALIRSQNVLDNTMAEDGLVYISDDSAKALGSVTVENNDILLNITGESVARVAVVDSNYLPARVNQHVMIIRPNKNVDSRYLQRVLVEPRMKSHLHSLAVGATRKALTKNMIQEIIIELPSLCEQRAIAEVLGVLDDKIAVNQRLSTTAERLMVMLVSGMARETELRQIAIARKTTVRVSEMVNSEVSHYSLPAFDEGHLPVVEHGSEIKSNKLMMERGCVLLSKLNPRFPRVWRVDEPEHNAVASTEFIVLEPKGVPASVLWAVMADEFTSRYLSERTTGTSGSHQRVRPEEVMVMPVPALTTFDVTLVDRLQALGKRSDVARSESRTLASLRDTLLPALMNGTLRVRDAEKQVSGVL